MKINFLLEIPECYIADMKKVHGLFLKGHSPSSDQSIGVLIQQVKYVVNWIQNILWFFVVVFSGV